MATCIYLRGFDSTPKKKVSDNRLPYADAHWVRQSLVAAPSAIERRLKRMPGIMDIYRRAPTWHGRRDIGRLVYVFFNGGFSCDDRCRILTPLPPRGYSDDTLHLFVDRIAKRSHHKRALITDCIFGCTQPHHPMLWDMIEECARRLYQLLETEHRGGAQGKRPLHRSDILWATGADVITSVYYASRGGRIALHPPGAYQRL